jgi:glutamate N-acetyltransferase/amino-acid N-acetyltransferase
MIYSDKPCIASGMFTTNKVFAAPVQICRERIQNVIHGILINSTNANACTGEEGYNNAISLLAEAEILTQSEDGSFLAASTGVIGRQLPVEKMKKSLPSLVEGLSTEQGSSLARAIMTTDTRPKETSREFSTPSGIFRIAGTAKGSGMIAPDMATMLSFIITDAPVSKKNLDQIFRNVVIHSTH